TQFNFLLSTPQFTDTPFQLNTVAYEEAAMPTADAYDSVSPNNDTSANASLLSGIWTEIAGPFPLEWFEGHAWVLDVPSALPNLSLHTPTDVDYYLLNGPAS